MKEKDKELILCISKKAVADLIDKVPETTLADAALRAISVPGMASVLPRGEVETDEELLQPIPYVTLVSSESGDEDGEAKVLVYRRSSKGGEKRLEDKYSIGFGGHVNADDMLNYYMNPEAESPMNVCFGRELNEELGLANGIECSIYQNPDAIYDEEEAVSRVHIGISYFMILMNRPELKVENTIADAEWVSIEDILPEGKYYDKLESWSKIVVKKLNSALSAGKDSNQ